MPGTKRTPQQKIADLERQIADEKAKLKRNVLKTAVKDGRVPKDLQGKYAALLRSLRHMEAAPSILIEFDAASAAEDAEEVRDQILKNLQEMVSSEEETEEETEVETEVESKEEIEKDSEK